MAAQTLHFPFAWQCDCGNMHVLPQGSAISTLLICPQTQRHHQRYAASEGATQHGTPRRQRQRHPLSAVATATEIRSKSSPRRHHHEEDAQIARSSQSPKRPKADSPKHKPIRQHQHQHASYRSGSARGSDSTAASPSPHRMSPRKAVATTRTASSPRNGTTTRRRQTAKRTQRSSADLQSSPAAGIGDPVLVSMHSVPWTGTLVALNARRKCAQVLFDGRKVTNTVLISDIIPVDLATTSRSTRHAHKV